VIWSAVDLHKTIRDLLDERNRLDAIITRLERTQAIEAAKTVSAPPKRRGRKNMPEEERRVVSERMRKYWAQRRKTMTAGAG
jgi:hypothetical protein